MMIVDGGNNCGNNLSDHAPLMMTLEIFLKKILILKQTNACKSRNIDRLKWHKSDVNSYYNAA